jgi:uncharacterized peroxidase-related enzyme
MAYIRHIPPSSASGRLAHLYREIRAEVPRVPNFMQVFSLRPETMEGLYRGWLANMWNGTLPRQTKELLAVVVSKVLKCEYCTDSHMIFLQAAGMDRADAFEVERDLGEAQCLTERERTAVRFAVRTSLDPRSVTPADLHALADAWPDVEERAQILSVIAAHNVIARIANALGVALEIPSALRRFETGRRSAITLLSRLTALSTDLGEKPLPARTPEENRQALTRLFRNQLGFSDPPDFSMLEVCPEIFDGQLRVIEKAVAVVPRDRLMRIGLVVGRLTGCDYFSANCAAWLRQRGVEASDVIAASEGARSSLSEAEECCLRFARDLTLHSHTIRESRIHELRRVGLSDGAILDLAYVGGVFNGVVRYVRTLSPLEESAVA